MRQRLASALLILAFAATFAGSGGLLIATAHDCGCVIKSPCCTGRSCPMRPKAPPKDGSFASCGESAPIAVRPRLLQRVVLDSDAVSAVEITPDRVLFAREPHFHESEFVKSPWRPPRASFPRPL